MNTNKIIAAGVIAAALVVGQVAGRWLHQPLDASVAPPSAATLTVPTAAELSSRFSEVSAEVDPAVVNINTETVVKHRFRLPGRGGRGGQPFGEPFDFFQRYFGGDPPRSRSQKRHSLGSGFVVDPKGTILTNYHVVHGADEIRVELASGEEFSAKLVGGDNFTDLAVIEIDAGKPLAAARLGNSDGMRRGDWVLAIGSPFGLERTITAGIISATARPGRSHWQRFLQTDAAINQGNSGGPLVNLAGEVIGVNTAILTSSGDNAGIGFAVPSNTAIQVYNQIVKHGRVTRGALGISMQTEAKPQALKALGATDGKGVIVQQVRPEDGPADRAGLQPGDVIVEMKGHKIGAAGRRLSPAGRNGARRDPRGPIPPGRPEADSQADRGGPGRGLCRGSGGSPGLGPGGGQPEVGPACPGPHGPVEAPTGSRGRRGADRGGRARKRRR